MNTPVTQKTMATILEETITAYTRETRAVNKAGTCCFQNEAGRRCAAGRCMTQPSKVRNGDITDLPSVDATLKPEYRGHSTDFWMKLQILHDTPTNWTSSGLSEVGKQFAIYIAQHFAIDLSEIPSLNS